MATVIEVFTAAGRARWGVRERWSRRSACFASTASSTDWKAGCPGCTQRGVELVLSKPLDVLDFFETAPMAEVQRVLKHATRIVADRTGVSERNAIARRGKMRIDSIHATAEVVPAGARAPAVARPAR